MAFKVSIILKAQFVSFLLATYIMECETWKEDDNYGYFTVWKFSKIVLLELD